MPPSSDSEVLRGTLDLMILKALSLESLHGWGISHRIRHLSADRFEVNQGSLYPALQRLEHRGWVTSSWQRTEENRRAKFYELTPKGVRQLERETLQWRSYVRAVDLVLAAGG